MSNILRTTSRVARFSRAHLATSSHLSRTRPVLLSPGRQRPWGHQRCRRYATVQPEESKDPKASRDNKAGDAERTDKSTEKPPPGFDGLYGASSPLSGGGPRNGKPSGGPGKRNNQVLTPDEERELDNFVTRVRVSLPKFSLATFDRSVAFIREYGMPPEMKEELEKFNASLGRAEQPPLMTIIRIATMLSDTMLSPQWRTSSSQAEQKSGASGAEDAGKAEQKGGANGAEDAGKAEQKGGASGAEDAGKAEQEAGEHDPGPPSGENGKKSKKSKKRSSDAPDLKYFKSLTLKFSTGDFVRAAIVTFILYLLFAPGENKREITWQEFKNTFLDKGLVEKIIVTNKSVAKVFLHRQAVAQMYPDSPAAQGNFYYFFNLGSVESFERRMDDAQAELNIPSRDRIPVAYHDATPWLSILSNFAVPLVLLTATILAMRSARQGGGGAGGIFGIGRSRAKRFNQETDVKIKFSDVAGMDEAKLEIMEFVSFLRDPGTYQKLGAKIPRGAILSGPPGTGKTLLAKATAGESGVPFFSVSGSEFVEMFVGVGASRVRDLFATARKHTPCIIFIDEIDAIGKARSKKNYGGGNDEREATLNQILTEMDGFNTSEQIVVIAGTNRADMLDQALTRPGRFDRHISIDKPTMEGRKQIFAVHLKNIVTKEEIEHLKGRLSAMTPGFSGADIANCVNEAALIAARYKAETVEMTHFEQAVERVMVGLEKKSLILTPEEKKVVAYHEAGHAICGWYFKWADPLLKVSIIPRGQAALGYAQYLPADTHLLNVNQLMDRMAMTLGGRVSEEIHFETVTSGASDDFKKVTRLALAMVTKFGMSKKIGYLFFDDESQQAQFQKPFSEETARNIDAEVRRLVDDAYNQCKNLLVEKKSEVGVVAEELLKKEVLTRDDLVRLLGPRPFSDNSTFSTYFGSSQERDKEDPNSGIAPDPTRPAPTPGPEAEANPSPAATRL